MKLVLDTNAYVDFAAGVPVVVDLIAKHGQQLFVPSIVLGELYFGFMKGRRESYNNDQLRHFLRALQVRVIPVDEEVARKYALIYLDLSQRGRQIPINDVWIAAACMNVGGTLLTRDRHFAAVAQIDKMIVDS